MDIKKRPLRILWLPVDDGGCGHHRVRMWNKAFNDLELAESALLDPTEEEEAVRSAIDYADVVVARLNTLPYIKLIKKTWPSKSLIFDWDDNTLETKASNPSYKNFGTRDVWVTLENYKDTQYYKEATVGVKLKMDEMKSIPLWVTGITPGFNRFLNLEQHTGLLYALMACDMATSPTPVLSQMWGKYAERVAVVPNALDLSYYPEVSVKRPRTKKEIRVGWSGGSSHSADFKSVMPTLEKVARKYPGFRLVINGSHFSEHFSGKEWVEYHPWTKWEAHPYKMKLLDLDFALIPLADDTSFNDFKSELKMMEFAALKVPMIIKDQLPYSPYIKKGENCLAYKTDSELEKCFDIMIKGRESAKLVANAYDWVVNNRDITKLAPEVVRLYKSVLPPKQQESIK